MTQIIWKLFLKDVTSDLVVSINSELIMNELLVDMKGVEFKRFLDRVFLARPYYVTQRIHEYL